MISVVGNSVNMTHSSINCYKNMDFLPYIWLERKKRAQNLQGKMRQIKKSKVRHQKEWKTKKADQGSNACRFVHLNIYGLRTQHDNSLSLELVLILLIIDSTLSRRVYLHHTLTLL